MLEKYIHTKFTQKPNKRQMTPIELEFTDIDEFNEVAKYCKENFMKVNPTKSGSMPYNNRVKLRSRYMIIQSASKIELTIVCYQGCYRFLIGNKLKKGDDQISGKDAVKAIYKASKEMNIDLNKYAVDSHTGRQIKTEIVPPHIEMFGKPGLVYTNVHHIDLNSSYASRISEVYPELKPFYETIYAKRHDNDGYYKQVLNKSIGCFQSEFCIDYNDKGRFKPYQFAGLAKIAVNNTRAIIEKYIDILTKNGRKVLLTNTDGIWYQGDIYEDENTGTELCQWKTDHKQCKFLMKSKGAYQFVENGVCYSRIRGTTNLDREKQRDDWEFGDIFKKKDITMDYYAFDEEEGVLKQYAEKI